MEIIPLKKDFALTNADKILALESNWVEIGDDPWNISNLMLELPLKWELSHFALYGGKIVGYQIGSLKEGIGFLNKIVVDKNIRNKGIGKELIKVFLEKCLSKGIDRVKFRVRTDNPAVAFYDKLGFRRLEEIDFGRVDRIPSYFYDSLIKEVLLHV